METCEQSDVSEQETILLLLSSDADSSGDDDVTSESDDDDTSESDQRPPHPPPNRSSVWKTTFNIINFMEGVGFLALPFAVRQGGITGVVAFVAIPLLCCYATDIITECLDDIDSKQTKKRASSGLKELGDWLVPKYGGLILASLQHIDLFLPAVSYLVVCGSLMYRAFPFVPLTETTWTCIAALIVLPTTFLRVLSQIAWLSALSVAALVGVILSVAWYGAQHAESWNVKSLLFWDTEGVFISISILLFSYQSVVILPSVRESIADKNKLGKAFSLAYLFTTLFKIVFSVIAFLTFGCNTDEVIVNNLPAGPVRITVSTLFLLSCLLSFSLPVHSVIEALHQTTIVEIVSSQLNGTFADITVRVLIVLSALLFALCVPHFALLSSFTGSLSCAFYVCILPSAAHLKLKWDKLKLSQICCDVLILIFGVMVTTVGVVVSCKALIAAQVAHNS